MCANYSEKFISRTNMAEQIYVCKMFSVLFKFGFPLKESFKMV